MALERFLVFGNLGSAQSYGRLTYLSIAGRFPGVNNENPAYAVRIMKDNAEYTAIARRTGMFPPIQKRPRGGKPVRKRDLTLLIRNITPEVDWGNVLFHREKRNDPENIPTAQYFALQLRGRYVPNPSELRDAHTDNNAQCYTTELNNA